jgi:adenylate kinase
MAIFSSLSPIAIIVLNDEPSSIYARIKDRDGEVAGVDGITKFQESEIKYSKLVSETLGAPYLLANPTTEAEVIKDFIIRNVI